MKRSILTVIVFLLTITMLFGCNSGNQLKSETEKSSGVTHNTLTVAVPVDIASLFQWDTEDTWAQNVLCHIVDPLWRFDPVDGSFLGVLAEQWETSADYRECRVKIREGIKFHNGDLLTTKDVKWTLEETLNRPICSRWTNNFLGVEVIDDYNCILHWSASDPNNLKYFAQNYMNILPADYFAKVGEEAYKQKPIGTGPFILESWARGDRMVFRSNKDYFLGAPTYDSLVIRMMPDSNSALMALEAGEVDVVCGLSPTFKEIVEKNPNLRWEEAISTAFVFIQINNQKPPFDDPRIRKALNISINREQLQAIALGGSGKLAPYGISIYSPQWKDDDPLPPYDPEAAKQLLSEAGFPNGLDLTLSCREGDFQKPASEVVQANWADIGINCKIDVMEKNAQMNDLITGNYQLGWQQTTDVLLDGSIWAMGLDSRYWGAKGTNRAFWKNERFDELNRAQMTETDPLKRQQYFDEMKQIYWSECPNIPGFFPPSVCVVNKDLKGTYAALGNFYRYERFSW